MRSQIKKYVFPFDNPVFWIISVLFIVITSFVSGSYPALYLSSFRPVKVLKGTFRAGKSAAVPRRIMVAHSVYCFNHFNNRDNRCISPGTACTKPPDWLRQERFDPL